MKKRVLVTGATGFIGRHVQQPLIDRGFEVHATYHKSPLDIKVLWHKADLLSASDAEALCREVRATHLLHFAWIATPGEFWTSPLNNDWKEATLRLVHEFQRNGGTRVVVAGSCAEYDWNAADKPFSEQVACIPATPYGKAKNETRIELEEVADSTGMSLAWGRIFFLYGPHEPESKFVAYIINQLLAGKKALLSHGEQIRDFLYVQDIAAAFCSLLDSDVHGAVNIASGTPISLKEIALEIAKQLGKEDLLSFGARVASSNEPARLIANVSRLQNDVGWTAQTSLKKGIEKTIRWWKENTR